MRKYKLYCVNNNTDKAKITGALERFNGWLLNQSNGNLILDWYVKDVNEEVSYQSADYFVNGSYVKYNFLDHSIMERYNKEATGFQAVVYFYDPLKHNDPGNVINGTHTLNGRVKIQIVAREDYDVITVYNELRHENIHGFFANLRLKGIYLNDLLDTQTAGGTPIYGVDAWVGKGIEFEKDNSATASFTSYNPASNYYTITDESGELIEIEKIKPYWNKLTETLPVDNVVLNGLMDKVKSLLAIVSSINKRVSVKQLAEAMAEFEGFYTVGTRAFRNNNPLNVKYVGQALAIGKDDKNFCIFKTPDDGWTTGIALLRIKLFDKFFNGTISDVIKNWTSGDPVENQNNYINFVCKKLGITPDYPCKMFKY